MPDTLTRFLQRTALHCTVADPAADAAPRAGARLWIAGLGSIGWTDGRVPRSAAAPCAVLAMPGADLATPLRDATAPLQATIVFDRVDDRHLALVVPAITAITAHEAPALPGLVAALRAEAAGDPPGHRIAARRLFAVLTVLALRHAGAAGRVHGASLLGLTDAHLAHPIAAVCREPQRDWPLETLAALAGMSRASFAAAFRDRIGETPADYVSGRRLAAAADLLRRGMRASQVAARVGYSSASALARAMGRHACSADDATGA